MLQVVIAAVVYIEIHIAFYARKTSGIGVLPELPRSVVFHFVDIIVGYPIGIVIEDGVAEIRHLEFMIGIDDGFYMVSVFNYVKPCKYITAKVLITDIFRLVLHIEYGREIAALQLHLA